MRPTILKTLLIAVVFVGGLLVGDSTQAAVISSINSPFFGSSNVIEFVDGSSLDPSSNPGGYYTAAVQPWGGAAPINHTLPLTIDPIGDFAQGSMTADEIGRA